MVLRGQAYVTLTVIESASVFRVLVLSHVSKMLTLMRYMSALLNSLFTYGCVAMKK